MSRTKKSRNPGSAPTAATKTTRKELVEKPEKRAKKQKGKQAGNKQKEATQQASLTDQPINKDPRLGSKKLIVLGNAPANAKKDSRIKPVAKKIERVKEEPIAAIRIAEPVQNNKLADELEAIEQDQALLVILSKQDDDIALTESEVNYFNDKMERHQELRLALGLSDDEDEDDSSNEQTTKTSSEDELWDKFDQSDLSKFEE